MRLQLPLAAVLVQGPSMAPTLRDGDALLIWRGAPVRPGDVVVARFRTRPDLLVVKRAVAGGYAATTSSAPTTPVCMEWRMSSGGFSCVTGRGPAD